MAVDADCDLLVIGGGINGAAIARDAAGRGLRVLLCERDDLAAHTSGASTRLLHGGLRYLEHGELRLVAQALAERERLLRLAPQLSQPLDFVLLPARGLRPGWLIRLGLFLYDHLDFGRRTLPATRRVEAGALALGTALRPDCAGSAWMYADGWTDDARLTVLSALDAAERGAAIRTRTTVMAAQREGRRWRVQLQARDGGQQVTARALVNAAGPWVEAVLGTLGAGGCAQAARPRLRLVRGSHIVVPRLYDGPQACVLQQPDRRIVFTIPYEQDWTLIGTTEVDCARPGDAQTDAAEIDYLCTALAPYFRSPPTPRDVVWHYAGVRPLLDDGRASSRVSRDWRLESDAGPPPLVSVYGGKLTTCRRLAEAVVDRLAAGLGCRAPAWTAGGPALPGGDFDDREALLRSLRATRPWLPPALAARLVRSYGTRASRLLGAANALAGLGTDFGAGLHAAEVDYLVQTEWARTAEDVLWRRSKLGLRIEAGAAARLADYLAEAVPRLSGGHA